MTEFKKDILNEPDQLAKCLAHTLGPGRAALAEAATLLATAPHLAIAGIGSSWHAGMAIAGIFQAAGRPACLFDASELLHFAELPKGSAVVVLSRSGRSTEIVKLLDKLGACGCRVIGITNTPDSPLGRKAAVTLRLDAEFDHMVSVAMYSGLALVGGLLAAAAVNSVDGSLGDRLAESIAAVKQALPAWERQMVASDWFAAEAPTYFLGRGASLASCHEARLLWEEATKSPASAMGTSGFRHGSQEILREGMRIGLWLDAERLRGEDLALAADLRKLGVKVMLIGQELTEDAGDLVLSLPAVPAAWQFVIDIVPAQLAAEKLSHMRGVSCDDFRLCPYIVEEEGGLL